MLVSLNYLIAVLLPSLLAAQQLPFTISSLQYPDSFHCFIKMDRGSALQLYSTRFTPNHLKLQTKDLQILIQPQIDTLNLLYNDPSNDKNSMGYIAYLNKTEVASKKTHFHYMKAKLNDTWIGYLASTLSQEIRAIRVDQLYRCSDILISVNWVDNNAQVWKFSQAQWIHIYDLHGAQVHRTDDMLYGLAIDENQANPIKIGVGYEGQYCLIDRNTQPVKLDFDWSQKSQYTLSEVLDLLQKNVEVVSNKVISQQL